MGSDFSRTGEENGGRRGGRVRDPPSPSLSSPIQACPPPPSGVMPKGPTAARPGPEAKAPTAEKPAKAPKRRAPAPKGPKPPEQAADGAARGGGESDEYPTMHPTPIRTLITKPNTNNCTGVEDLEQPSDWTCFACSFLSPMGCCHPSGRRHSPLFWSTGPKGGGRIIKAPATSATLVEPMIPTFFSLRNG